VPLYGGSRIMWKTRRARRVLRPPLVWMRHRGLSPADTAIVSYPRSGSTWLASMIAELMLGSDPDFKQAHAAVPEVCDARGAPPVPGRVGRVVRSHESARGEYRRALYLVRDPRDVAVSYYHYRKWLREYDGSLGDFVRLFVDGDIDSYGTWGHHVTSWLERDPDTRLVLRYEDLVASTKRVLHEGASFLGVSAECSGVDLAVSHHTAARMRVKERAGHQQLAGTDPRRSFVRSARSGDWAGALSPDSVDLIESAFAKQCEVLGYATQLAPPADSERYLHG
jgi:Sulfotransferase domain